MGLDGDDAFDKVLDRLVDAAHERAVLRRHLDQTRDELKQAHEHVAAARAECGALRKRLDRHEKEAQPRLTELWNAAAQVRMHVHVNGDDKAVAARERLIKALGAARDACDILPLTDA